MADLKISQLNSIVTVVPATDVLPVVQGGTTLKITPNQILGSGGTATLASATITGDLTVDTSTLKVDSTNNRVGIKQASPSYPFQIGTTDLILDASGNVGIGVVPTNLVSHIRLEIKASGAPNLTFRTASVNAAARDWQVTTNDAAFAELAFKQGASQGADPNSGTTRFVLTASGDVSVSTGNVVMATSGKGIDFSATASGSGTMTSELLNDYEEGTWTPTLNVGTFSAATCRYTKIGNMVTLFFDVTVGTGGGAVGGIGKEFAASRTSNLVRFGSYFTERG
jgi:hypothetical protein